MPLPPFSRTATGRVEAALCCWVAMAYRADMLPAKVSDDPGSVQSGSDPDRVRILSGSGGPARAGS